MSSVISSCCAPCAATSRIFTHEPAVRLSRAMTEYATPGIAVNCTRKPPAIFVTEERKAGRAEHLPAPQLLGLLQHAHGLLVCTAQPPPTESPPTFLERYLVTAMSYRDG